MEGRLVMQSRITGLLPLNSAKLLGLGSQADHQAKQQPDARLPSEELVIILSRHKYYRHIRVDIMHVGRTKAGRLKPPFRRLQPLDLLSSATNVDEAKFFEAKAR